MNIRRTVEVICLLLLVLSITIGLIFIAGSMIKVSFSVGGPMCPLKEGTWYKCKGRSKPGDPVVEIWIMLVEDIGSKSWSKSMLTVSNHLKHDIEVHIDISIYGHGVTVAEGHAFFFVRAKDKDLRLVKLTWTEGKCAEDAVWGKLYAEVLEH